jgi:long-chain acyl-CoA synthetase
MKELVYPRVLLPALEQYADKLAFFDGGYENTMAGHGERVLRLADAMRHEIGLEPGDRFAIMALNSHQFLELYHAGFLGAGVVTPLNLRLAGAELQHIVRDSGARAVFVDAMFAQHLANALDEVRGELDLEHVVLIGGDDLDVPHDIAYEDLLAAGRPIVPPEPEEDDAVVLMYTGGTTGLPKGVVLDQRSEMLNLYHAGIMLGLPLNRVCLHQTPMFHAASMTGVLGIPATGATSVFTPLFEPGAVLDLIEERAVTQTVMVPTMIRALLNHPDYRPERLASLEELTYGASPMSEALLIRLLDELPWIQLSQGYGMTESSAVLTMMTAEDHRRGGDLLQSAGRAVFGVRLSIQDEDGQTLPKGEIGEVCAQGGNLMREYWNNPAATAEAFRGGWYHTGDKGRIDAEGYLYLVDRVKDMIVSGGENVYSIEVENALVSHPSVDEVAVIGIPDETWGEAVHAIVVLNAGMSVSVDGLREWARDQIAGYKVPKSIEMRTEPLPLSGALKPLKRLLRAPYWVGHDRSVQ